MRAMQKLPPLDLRPGYWALLFLLLLVGHSGHPMDSDEGMILNGAWNPWNGRTPYTDFFEYMTPGSFHAVFWLWKLFEPHYLVAKALAVLSVFSGCIGIYLTGRLLAFNGFSYAGPLLYALASFGWPLINHNTFNIVLIIWAMYFFARSLGTASIPWISASGLTAGLSALFLQHKGAILVLATAAFLVFLWASEKRSVWLKGLFAYLLCAAAPLLILLKWPLESLFVNLVWFPLFHYSGVNKVSLWPWYLACCALFASLSLLRGGFNRVVGFLALAQVALLLTTLQRTDYMHVSITLAPLLALLPYLHARAELKSKRVRWLQFFPLLAFLISFLIGVVAIGLSHMYYFGQEGAPDLKRFVRLHCGGSPYLYAGPFLPGLYYETRKLNATSFSVLLTGFNTPEQFDQARKELETHKPSCVVMNHAMVEKYNYDLNNPVDEYIRVNYEHEKSFGNSTVYMRKL